MKQLTTWMFLAATLISGCKNSTLLTRKETLPVSFPRVAALTVPEQSVPRAKLGFAPEKNDIETGNEANERHFPTKLELNNGPAKPPAQDEVKKQKQKLCEAIRPVDSSNHGIERKPGGARIEVSTNDKQVPRIAKTPLPIEKQVVAKDSRATQPELPAVSNHTMSPESVWYIIAPLGGAIFTGLLGPILVDLIRIRMGNGRVQTGSDEF